MASLSNINGLFDVHSTGAILFSTSHGASGQILRSNGNAAPTWVAASTVIGGPYLPLSGGTLTGATATASGISFTVGGALTVSGNATASRLFSGDGGNKTNPMIANGSDEDTGIFFPSANVMAFTAGDTEALRFTSGNSTFGGNVSTAADKRVSVGTWDNSAFTGGNAQGFSVQGVTPGLFILETDQTNKKSYLAMSGGAMYLGGSIDFLALDTDGARAITIDDSQNSTFTGNVQANGGIKVVGPASHNSIQSANDYTLGFNDSGGTSQWWIKAYTNGGFALHENGVGDKFTIAAGGNATFADSITATSASIPTMSVNTNFVGSIFQYGSTFRTSSFINLLNNRNTKKYLETAYFTNGLSNQAVNIQFPNVAMQGYYKITLSGSYSHQDISGKLTKVIPFGYNPNGSIWRTGDGQSEITIATGGVSTNFTIGNLAWDSTNSKFIVPIYKLTNTGNAVKILVEYLGGAANNLKDVTLSSNYTLTAPSPFNVRQYQNIRDKLGIGTTTPGTYKLNVAGTGLFTGGLEMAGGGAVYQGQKFWLDGGGDTFLESPSSNIMTFTTGGTERMRIKSNGQIDFASPGTPNQSGISMFGGTSGGIMYMYRPVGQNGDIIRFQTAISSTASTRVGYINTTSSATTYNSASDYRLKENVTKITNALDRVSKLKPSRFNFIIEPKNTVDGFIAHEVQKIVPEAVTGVKDDIDENGNNHYQGMDNARLVPLLTAAIQELEARVKELENK